MGKHPLSDALAEAEMHLKKRQDYHRLAKAAPDLLAALRLARYALTNGGSILIQRTFLIMRNEPSPHLKPIDGLKLLAVLDAAIAKAEG